MQQRNERVFLQDMYDACVSIERFVGGRTMEEFLRDEAACTAVLYKLLVIGEASNHIRGATRRNHTEVEWNRVHGMRNFLAHVYFGVNWEIIWNTVERRIPTLKDQLAAILAEPPSAHRATTGNGYHRRHRHRRRRH